MKFNSNGYCNSSRTEIFLILVIVSLFLILHIGMGSYPRSIQVQMDEILYYDIAKNINSGLGLSYFLGEASNFKKIAYSLVISPAFAIKDGSLRMQVINCINCFLILSSIIPCYLIFKSISLSPSNRILASVLILSIPELLASTLTMAEVLYWPISLLWVYVYLRNSKCIRSSLLLGFITFIGYLTKEIFLVLPVAQIILFLGIVFIDIYKSNNLSSALKYSRSFFLIATELLFFISLSFSLDRYFLTTSSGSYGSLESTVSTISSNVLNHLLPFCFGVVYYVLGLLLSVWFLPVVIPIAKFKDLTPKSQTLFLFTIIACFITIFITVCMITLNEDLGYSTPRLHLRYFGPYLPLFYAVFLNSIDKMPFSKNIAHRIILITTLLIALLFLFFSGIAIYSPIDQFSVLWFKVPDLLFSADISSGTSNLATLSPYLSKFVCALMILICLRRINQTSRIFKHIFVLTVLCFSFISSLIGFKLLQQFSLRSPSEIQEVENVNKYLNNHVAKNATVAYITENADKKTFNNAMTFINGPFRMIVLSENELLGFNGAIELQKTNLHDIFFNRIYQNLSSVDYILIDRSTNFRWLQLNNTMKVSEVQNRYFALFKNLNPSELSFKNDNTRFYEGGSVTKYYTRNTLPGGFIYVDSGLGRATESYTWTFSKEIPFVIPVNNFKGTLHTTIRVKKVAEKQQQYIVSSGGKAICTGVLSGSETISFDLPAVIPFTRFSLLLPDAKLLPKSSPSAKDIHLGIALESITISDQSTAKD